MAKRTKTPVSRDEKRELSLSTKKAGRGRHARTPKGGEYWVVEMFGEREIVLVSGSGEKMLTCGNDEGFRTDRKDIGLKWVRRVRL